MTVGVWKKVGKCSECGSPIWANDLRHCALEPPRCLRSCRCVEELLPRMKAIEDEIERLAQGQPA
jgi:hypothetical protein